MTTHKYHYTYKTTRQDGKYYIGVHSTNQLHDKYLGSGTVLKASINKHGKEFHKKEILKFHESREIALYHESLMVSEETIKDPLCMNIILGGGGTYDTTRISSSLKGKPQPKSVCESISKRRKGVATWGRPVSIDGVIYKSAAEAGRVLGISDRTVTSRCRRDKLSDWKFADVQAKKIRDERKHPKAKSVMINGIFYKKIGDAVHELKTCSATVKRKCESDKFPNWYYV